MTDEIKEKLAIIVNSIKSVMPVSAMYLFGSYANGTPHADSDLDIYVLTNDKSKRWLDWGVEARMAIPRLYMPLDLLVDYEDNFMHHAKNRFTFEHTVFTEGIKLV